MKSGENQGGAQKRDEDRQSDPSRGRTHPDGRAAGKAAAQGAQGARGIPRPVPRRPARRRGAARAGEQGAVFGGDAQEDRGSEAGVRPGSGGGGQSSVEGRVTISSCP